MLIQKAINKLEFECEKDINRDELVTMANYIRDTMGDDPRIAELIIDSNKSLEGAFKACQNYAKKKASSRKGYYMSDAVMHEVVDEYFGFNKILEGKTTESTDGKKILSLADLI